MVSEVVQVVVAQWRSLSNVHRATITPGPDDLQHPNHLGFLRRLPSARLFSESELSDSSPIPNFQVLELIFN